MGPPHSLSLPLDQRVHRQPDSARRRVCFGLHSVRKNWANTLKRTDFTLYKCQMPGIGPTYPHGNNCSVPRPTAPVREGMQCPVCLSPYHSLLSPTLVHWAHFLYLPDPGRHLSQRAHFGRPLPALHSTAGEWAPASALPTGS